MLSFNLVRLDTARNGMELWCPRNISIIVSLAERSL
jgi:hypothetical protein